MNSVSDLGERITFHPELDYLAFIYTHRSVTVVVLKTRQLPSPLVKFGYACIVGLALLATGSNTYAQGANVDLNQPDERVSETGDELQQTMVEGVTRLYFAFGAETLDSNSQSALLGLVKQAEANPANTIMIKAHTDNRGWALGNLQLSKLRARSVAIALIANGVDVSRMRAFAFGESRPVALNSTAQGRRLNRRVEVSLMP